jgi:hypothetical protein
MSVLKFPLLFVGSKEERIIYTLFDSGVNYPGLIRITYMTKLKNNLWGGFVS